MKITVNHLAILEFVKSMGGVDVETSATLVKQNKNFYNRVRVIENRGFVKVKRFDGYPSRLTLTDLGKKLLNKTQTGYEPIGQPGKIEMRSDVDLLKSLIRGVDLDIDLKNKILLMLS